MGPGATHPQVRTQPTPELHGAAASGRGSLSWRGADWRGGSPREGRFRSPEQAHMKRKQAQGLSRKMQATLATQVAVLQRLDLEPRNASGIFHGDQRHGDANPRAWWHLNSTYEYNSSISY